MPTRVLRGRRVPGGGIRRALRAWIALCIIDVALRVRGVQKVLRDTSKGRPADRPVGIEELRRAVGYAQTLERASRFHPLPARCLHRSLVLHGWLRREGFASTLRIGVRKEAGRLLAHAWVELGGQVVSDRAGAVAAFTPLAGSSAAGARFASPNRLAGDGRVPEVGSGGRTGATIA